MCVTQTRPSPRCVNMKSKLDSREGSACVFCIASETGLLASGSLDISMSQSNALHRGLGFVAPLFMPCCLVIATGLGRLLRHARSSVVQC